MRAVIMAGGKGTRIAPVHPEVPKPMIRILGKPVLEYQIDCLSRQGITDITLVVGHLGHVIKDYFGDGGLREGQRARVTYLTEEQPLGTAGALYFLKDNIDEDFLLLNGDILFDVDLERFLRFHRRQNALATLFTHPNDHPCDSGIVAADETGRVERWLCPEDPRTWYPNRVNAGLHLLSPKVLDGLTKPQKLDLDRDVLRPLIATGRLFAYGSPEYVKDMGTPDRLLQVQADIESGKVRAKNLKNTQRAVFLDRDGTINKQVGFLKSIDDFELLDGVSQAIRKINRSGRLAIVVTNQPVIARGEVSRAQLEQIHNKMETLLGAQGAYLDAIFYCPHHPDGGFLGEVAAYKTTCMCRKPKPGLLLQAAEQYNIDLTKSWMLGDSLTDAQTGKNAGCSVALVQGASNAGITSYDTLLDGVNDILRGEADES